MLRINRLLLENFGPFKGKQTIAFPERPGVTIVYGENMRGKTSLLNAMRFALFGSVLWRGMRDASLELLGNWESAAEGEYGFSVTLDLTNGPTQYRLTRNCRPRRGIEKPKSSADYDLAFFLERAGAVLGPDAAAAELKRILPEQIARFFLFDGELLQEYEDLLRDESDMGRRISEAIERILGVPILTEARVTAGRLRDDYEKREAKAAQRSDVTELYGVHLESLQAERSALQNDKGRLQREMETLRTQKASLEAEMRSNERVSSMIEKRDGLARSVGELEARLAERRFQLQKPMAAAWSWLLAERIEQLASSVSKEEQEIGARSMRREVLKALRDDTALECPACAQPLSVATKERLRAEDAEPDGEADRDRERIRELHRQSAALASLRGEGERQVAALLWDELDHLEQERFGKKEELEEITRRLEDVNEASLREAKENYDRSVKEIAVREDGLAKTEEKLKENREVTDKIRRKLEEQGGADLAAARRRTELCTRLHVMFDEAVGLYRDRLREQVERDASMLFLKLTTEPDYAGLRINETYGLRIVHRDGEVIQVRSAGAEHVVALSLMGALQRNAPMKGPIIVDSPFGRLDSQHTRNVVESLPVIAEQVMLLVYEDELSPQVAREGLRENLRAEFILRRVSARHTSLERRMED